jgi:hypothetical protein
MNESVIISLINTLGLIVIGVVNKFNVQGEGKKIRQEIEAMKKHHDKEPLHNKLEEIHDAWLLEDNSPLSAALALYMVLNVRKAFDLIVHPHFTLKSYRIAESLINGMRNISRRKSKNELPFTGQHQQQFNEIVDVHVNRVLSQLRILAEDDIQNAKYERTQAIFIEYAIGYKISIIEFLKKLRKEGFNH